MITRREFIGFGALSLASIPLIGCFSEVKDTHVNWFLSEQEILKIGKLYATNVFSSIDEATVLVNGWVITRDEADVCQKKYLENA